MKFNSGAEIIDDDDSNEPEIRGSSVLPILKEAMRKIAHYKESLQPPTIRTVLIINNTLCLGIQE